MVFRKIRRVLKPDGIVWLNLASTYASENGGTPNAPETLSMRHGNGKRGRPDGYNPRRDPKVIGYKHKDLIPIPWLVGLALQKDGWWLRNDCILEKLNVMPYSGEDRCAMSHEYVLLLAKSEHYYFDYEAIMEPAEPNDQREAIRLIQVEKKSQGQVAHIYKVDRSTISRMMTEVRLKQDLKGGVL